jgi:hypothetical protein
MANAESATQNDTLRYYMRPVLTMNRKALDRVKVAVADKASRVYNNEALTKLIHEIESRIQE